MVTTFNSITETSLPTQPREAQWWEGGHFPPLALREAEAEQPATFEVPAITLKAEPPSASKSKPSVRKQLLLILILTALCLAGYYVVSRYVATSVIVQGRSMVPTLHDGERFILNRLSYLRKAPQRGDLVVVKDPGHKDFAVKRVVAMPNEILHFKEGKVTLNGNPLSEPYLAPGTRTLLPDSEEKLVMLGNDQYFVLGDNRGVSEDSRFYGPVHRAQIVGSLVR